MSKRTKEQIQEIRDKQIESVYDFICSYKSKNNGNFPTVREIRDRCDLSSTSLARNRLEILERVGRIYRLNEDASRGWGVVNSEWRLTNE